MEDKSLGAEQLAAQAEGFVYIIIYCGCVCVSLSTLAAESTEKE